MKIRVEGKQGEPNHTAASYIQDILGRDYATSSETEQDDDDGVVIEITVGEDP